MPCCTQHMLVTVARLCWGLLRPAPSRSHPRVTLIHWITATRVKIRAVVKVLPMRLVAVIMIQTVAKIWILWVLGVVPQTGCLDMFVGRSVNVAVKIMLLSISNPSFLSPHSIAAANLPKRVLLRVTTLLQPLTNHSTVIAASFEVEEDAWPVLTLFMSTAWRRINYSK